MTPKSLQDPVEVGYLTCPGLFEKPSQTRRLSHRAREEQSKYLYFMYFIMLTNAFFKKQEVFTDKGNNAIILSSSKLINLKYGGFF